MTPRIVICSGPSKGLSLPVPGKVARLGTASYCEVVLPASDGLEAVVVNIELRDGVCSLFNATARSLQIGDAEFPARQHRTWNPGVPLVLSSRVSLVLEMSGEPTGSVGTPGKSSRLPITTTTRAELPLESPAEPSDTTQPRGTEPPGSSSQTKSILLIVLCVLAGVAIVFWDTDSPAPDSQPVVPFETVFKQLLDIEGKCESEEQRNWLRRWRTQLQQARQAQLRGDSTASKAQYRQLYQSAMHRLSGIDEQPPSQVFRQTLLTACDSIARELQSLSSPEPDPM